MRLEVPCFRQEQSYTCVPACLRMVLAYLGRPHSEADLARLCGTSRVGTSETGLTAALESLGCDYDYLQRAEVGEVAAFLAEERPVIVFVRVEHLTPAASGRHAVVVCGIDSSAAAGEPTGIVVLNPASGTEEVLPPDAFLRAWNAQGREGVVVWDAP